MANVIRRPQHFPESAWDPMRVMREMMGWDPFAEMLPSQRGGEAASFVPSFDVKETKDAYVFKADLPGVKEEDLDITLTGNRLTLSGKREAAEREENDRYYAYERSYGSFTRSFTLPEGADVEHVDADLSNGVLTLTVGKRPENQPRRVTLKGLADKVKGALGGKEKGKA